MPRPLRSLSRKEEMFLAILKGKIKQSKYSKTLNFIYNMNTFWDLFASLELVV